MKSLKAGLANVKAAGFNAYKSANEAVRPAQSQSTFEQDGVRPSSPERSPSNSGSCVHALSVLSPCFSHCRAAVLQKLTPEEFTAAGDFLVRTYPTWCW